VPVEIDSRLVPYRGTRARVVTLRDLSERQRTEEAQRLADERERQIERLEELDRLRTQFLNNSAHELATPLTPIQIQFAILDRRGMQNLDEAQRRALQLIRRNFERLARLVRALLDAAQIQRGVLGLDRRVFPVHEMLRDLEATFATTARDRGIEFAVMTDVAITVHADRVRIGQVLENLLENAFKFTPRYGRVSLEASLEDGAARLRVADTGIGLTPEQRERLFRPFAQPYDDTHAVPTGAGLGLFVARGIVEAHGSRLEVDSPGHGHGATFAFRLPLAERAA
jgi:signal transduction histidine kinase